MVMRCVGSFSNRRPNRCASSLLIGTSGGSSSGVLVMALKMSNMDPPCWEGEGGKERGGGGGGRRRRRSVREGPMTRGGCDKP